MKSRITSEIMRILLGLRSMLSATATEPTAAERETLRTLQQAEAQQK